MLYSTDFVNRCVTLCHIPVLAVRSDVIFVYYNTRHDIILAANSAGTSQLQGLGFDPGIPGTGSGFSVSPIQWLLKVNERIPHWGGQTYRPLTTICLLVLLPGMHCC